MQSSCHLFNCSTLDSGPQSLVQVGDDVLGVLQADAEPDQVVRHPEGHSLLLLDGGVSHQVGQLRQTLVAAKGLSQGDDLNNPLSVSSLTSSQSLP